MNLLVNAVQLSCDLDSDYIFLTGVFAYVALPTAKGGVTEKLAI